MNNVVKFDRKKALVGLYPEEMSQGIWLWYYQKGFVKLESCQKFYLQITTYRLFMLITFHPCLLLSLKLPNVQIALPTFFIG